MKIRLFVGTNDKLYNDNGTLITTRFHQLLESLKIPHSYHVVDEAGHNPIEIFAPDKLEYDTNFWDKAFFH